MPQVEVSGQCQRPLASPLAVDENGDVVDGDKIIAICAKDMKERGELDGDAAVVTVMSNMGFHKFCADNDIHCEITKVGDRYVLERMLEKGYAIGGEQSGHVIFLHHSTTGDGEVTAAQVLQTMKRTGKSLSELAKCMEVYPQVLKNVRVSNIGKVRFSSDEEIKKAIAKAEAELGEDGRVLVRVSGTEPLVRVMLEGKDEKLIEKLCDEIAEVLNYKIAEYAKAVVDGRPSFHISIVRDISPDCDCHPENDVPMVPDVGMFASFDPVALDLACAEAVNRQPVLPGSRLAETADPEDHDHLHAMHPNTCWRAAVEHGKKIGLGTDDYTVITVK